MRKLLTLAAICLLAAGIATAQMKPKASSPAVPGQKSPLIVPGAAQQNAQAQALANVRRISTEEASRLVDRGEAVFVDVRSNEAFSLGHIRGAYSIPGSQLMSRIKELPPGKMIITYCACTAEQSSGRAVIDLNNHGIKHAAALKGGWDVWKSEGRARAAGPK